MNRQIKFRAWDGETMHQWDSTNHSAVDLIKGTPYPKLFYLPMSWLVGDSNDWKWMQFTGLLDKNGKEIYEGDIVKISPKDKMNLELIEEVKWVDEKNWMADKCPVNGFVNHESIYKTKPEVIGNIYENPELLKS